MKNIFIYLSGLFFITISCKSNTDIKKTVSIFTKSNSYKKTEIIKEKMTCDEVFKKIIKSSNLDLKNYINGFVNIKEISDNFITAQVYFKNNLPDYPEKMQIVENTIASLSFNSIKVKLYNTKADSENHNFDKNRVKASDIFDSCKTTENHKKVSQTSLKFSMLPEISKVNYGKNIQQSDPLKSNNYLRYFFMAGDTLPVGSGKNFHANNYLYLQKLNSRSKIASNSSADTELYSVIVIRDNKIIATLEIDLKNKEILTQLDVRKDDIINLKRKDISNKNTKWKSYRIMSNGKMAEL